jgi:hypothetical protein
MSTKTILLGALPLALAACVVPPMYERAAFGPPPEYWQENGRFRQTGVEPGSPRNEPATSPANVAAAQSPSERVPSLENPGEGGVPPAAPAPAAPLYAWDGGVVDGAPQGRVTSDAGTPRGLEAPSAGRTHIIELYQQVLDERDALAQEVEQLRRDLQQTREALEAKSKQADELGANVAALEATRTELVAENQALAARLVQAQIRRLEAEKLLLEARIEQERTRAEAARAAAAAVRPGAKTKPAPKASEGDE